MVLGNFYLMFFLKVTIILVKRMYVLLILKVELCVKNELDNELKFFVIIFKDLENIYNINWCLC